MGKAIWWILGLIGAGFVVYKVGPKVMDAFRSGPKQLPAGARSSTVLVPCTSGGSSAPGGVMPMAGVQSSPGFRWCYLVREGDNSGTISERIAGDTARYAEILVANPAIAKKGSMGVVMGSGAWDFADGALMEGTKIFIPQTMNAWIDQTGVAKGTYEPYPVDPRAFVSPVAPVFVTETEAEAMPAPAPAPSMITGTTTSSGFAEGFDYEGSA